jgi:hypothetical protein
MITACAYRPTPHGKIRICNTLYQLTTIPLGNLERTGQQTIVAHGYALTDGQKALKYIQHRRYSTEHFEAGLALERLAGKVERDDTILMHATKAYGRQ